MECTEKSTDLTGVTGYYGSGGGGSGTFVQNMQFSDSVFG